MQGEGNEAGCRTIRYFCKNGGRIRVRAGDYLAIGVGLWTAAYALCPGFAAAVGADSAYTVANYPVEATAANAVAAKDQALADGQQAAFRSLLKRIVPVTAYKQLVRVSNVKAADLISGVAVRSERNSATEYIASLDFSFVADGVRGTLSREGVPFVDEQAPPVTVITALLQGNPPAVSNDTGLWRSAWTGLDLQHTITPVAIQDLKPTVHADTVTMLLAGDDNGLRILNDDYGTRLIVMAVGETDLTSKKLTVTLAGRDAVGPLLLKRTYRLSNSDLDYASQLAAVVALGVLEGRWKAVKTSTLQSAATNAPVWAASTSGNGEDVSFVVEFVSSQQWDQIRTQLLDTPGVDALEISTVSDRNADVTLKFPGGVRGLANALGARGWSLVDTPEGWFLRPNN
jgi:hypothetical protein